MTSFGRAGNRARVHFVQSLVVVVIAMLTPLVAPSTAGATAACSASTATVTALHTPDGTARPFYADFRSGSTLHSGYVGYQLGGSGLGSDPWIKLSGFSSAISLGTNQSASIPSRSTSSGGAPLVYAYLKASTATSSAQSFTVEVWNGKPGGAGSTLVCSRTDGFSSVEDIISAAANKITGISASTSTPVLGGSFDITATGTTGTIGSGISTDRSGGNGVMSMSPSMDDSWPADAFTLTGLGVTIGGTTTNDRLRIYPGTAAAGAYSVTYHFAVRSTTGASTPVRPVQNIASGTQVKYTGTYDVNISVASPVQTTSLAKTVDTISGTGPYSVTYQVVATNTGTSAVTLDYLADTPTTTAPATWQFDTGSTTVAGVATADPALSSGQLIFAGPFAIPGRVGSTNGTLVFTYRLLVSGPVDNAVAGQVGGQTLTTTGGSTGNQTSVNPAAPTITTATALPDGPINTGYSRTLAAAGGSGTYTDWTVTSGSLPAGLTLDATTGVISGTPTSSGTASFTVRVTDSASASSSKAFTLTTVDPVVVSTTSLANCAVATSCTRSLSATGGSGTYVGWAITAGALPAGLAIDAVTGAITGTPTATGTSNFTVEVTDDNGATATRALSITVVAGAPTVTTNAATGVTTGGATLHGVVSPNGATATTGFEFGTVSDLSSGVTSVSANESPLSADSTTSAAVTGLAPSTTYYVRAIATNSVGTTQGGIVSFTSGAPPSTTTTTTTMTTTTTTPAPAPTAGALTSTGPVRTAQTATVTVPQGGSVRLLDGSTPVNSLAVTGVGTYVVNPYTGVITFTPASTFRGTPPPIDFVVENAYGQTANGTYTPTVSLNALTASPVTSQGVATAVHTTTIPVPSNGEVHFLNGGTPATSMVIPGEGTYVIVPSTGIVTFTPDLGFWGAGTTLSYDRTDDFGQSATSTYLASVTKPAPPTAPSANSRSTPEAPLAPQLVTVAIPPLTSITLVDPDGNEVTSVTIDGQGTYVLDPTTGEITFTPVDGFAGPSSRVAIRLTDAYGQPATGVYTATIAKRPVTNLPVRNGTPGPRPSVTIVVPPGGSITLVAPDGTEGTTVTIDGQGTYTLDPATGELTFTPVDGFTGTPTPVTYRVTAADGSVAQGTFAPTVLAAETTRGSPPPTEAGSAAPSRLAFTGGSANLALLGAMLMFAGIVLLRPRRRRILSDSLCNRA